MDVDAAAPNMERNDRKAAAPRGRSEGGCGRKEIIFDRKIDNVTTEESLQKGGARRFPLRECRRGAPHYDRMKRGKKSLAERIVYTAIDKSREGSDSVDPLEVVNKAVENVRRGWKSNRVAVGGATYQVPME